MANYTQITLGELLSSENETIKRNAVSILKQLQKPKTTECDECKMKISQYEYNKNKGFCNICNDVYKQ